MLYSSVCQLGPWEDYGEFLEGMQPRLRAWLHPMDVLHFWQAAAGAGDAEHWLAAFTLDEVGMMVAMCPPKSSYTCPILL